jgi:hypothetical protein
VGHIETIVCRFGAPVLFGPWPAPVWLFASGVGQYFGVLTTCTSDVPVMLSVIVPPRELSEADGVGHNTRAIT